MRHWTPLIAKSALLAGIVMLMPAVAANGEAELAGGPDTMPNMIVEPDTYRFGYPYRSERGTTPEQCAAQCEREARCAAWSLTPATFKVGPRCELKRKVGTAEPRPGGVSGVALRPYPAAATQTSAGGSERRILPPLNTGAYSPAPPPSAPSQKPINQQPRIIMPATSTAETATPAPRPVAEPKALPKPIPAPQPLQVPAVDAMRRAAPRPQPVAVPAPKPAAPPAPAVNAMTRARPVVSEAIAPLPAPPVAPAAQPATRVAPPPAPPRKPWTERTADDIDYSVQEMDFIPGDREATAGFLSGAPEEPED